MNSLFIDYNHLLARYKKAEAFLDNPQIDMDTKMKYMPDARKIMVALSEILDKLKENGYQYTQEEALEGFITQERKAV
jgi:hypothetical protein